MQTIKSAFRVDKFNRETEKFTHGLSKQAKGNVRMLMLYKCLKHEVKLYNNSKKEL